MYGYCFEFGMPACELAREADKCEFALPVALCI
jgi:hypothetical protein